MQSGIIEKMTGLQQKNKNWRSMAARLDKVGGDAYVPTPPRLSTTFTLVASP